MSLNDLSLEDLIDLQRNLSVLMLTGKGLGEAGIATTFNLTPGQPATITLGFRMPEAPGQATQADVERIEAKLDRRLEALEDTVEANGLHLLPTVMSGPWNEPEPRRDWSTEAEAVVIQAYRSETEPQIDPSHAAANALLRIGLVINPDRVGAYVRAHLVGEIREARITPSPEVAQPEPALVPEETPLAAGDTASGAPLSVQPSRPDVAAAPPSAASEATAESGGGAVMAAAIPPAAADPTPAPASHQEKSLPATWTADEDENLIAIVVNLVRLGNTKKAAIAAAARELGRPEQGTIFRAHHKLKARIDRALTEAALHQAQTETPIPEAVPNPAEGDTAAEGATPAAVQSIADEPDMEPGQRAAEIHVRAVASIEGQLAEAALDPVADLKYEARSPEDVSTRAEMPANAASHGDAAVGDETPAAVQDEPVKALHRPEHIADEVTSHLMALPDKGVFGGGWTVERDLELMELSIAGWQSNEIALQLQVQANLIRPRFDALTGLYEDATGKKVRRFARDHVFAALSRLAGKAA